MKMNTKTKLNIKVEDALSIIEKNINCKRGKKITHDLFKEHVTKLILLKLNEESTVCAVESVNLLSFETKISMNQLTDTTNYEFIFNLIPKYDSIPRPKYLPDHESREYSVYYYKKDMLELEIKQREIINYADERVDNIINIYRESLEKSVIEKNTNFKLIYIDAPIIKDNYLILKSMVEVIFKTE